MNNSNIFITGLGQDSHKFEDEKSKPLILGGIEIEYEKSLKGNSDADPVLHAITNAVSSISGKNILGKYADELCKNEGITDSAVYLEHAQKYLKNCRILHCAVSIECLEPKLSKHIEKMKDRIAALLNLKKDEVGITATTGEGLTEFGKGNGIQTLATLSVMKFSKQ